MSRRDSADTALEDTGPIGPVALFALVLLVVASPLMRGGNRHVALIAIEAIALALLVAAAAGVRPTGRHLTVAGALLGLLVTSPAWLALVYLLPIPVGVWTTLPGHAQYPGALSAAGIAMSGWLPISLAPDATASSLFAGIPIAAAFLAGFGLRLPQVRRVLQVFVGVALVQVVVGLLQVAGGASSSFYFGGVGGRPFGTFANPNHYADYLAMALAAYVWLAYASLSSSAGHRNAHHPSTRTRRVALWAAGGVMLAVGILLSRSRGAMLAGLPAGLCALAVAVLGSARARAWRMALVVTGAAVVATLSMVGFQFVLSRFEVHTFASDASLRTLLAETTFQGAWHFWPFGAGWGTYPFVYPRFQPASIVGFANQAHQDYAQLLFEGGIFALILMAAFAWLAGTRAVELVRAGMRRKRLRREEMVSALCGLGLLGFLLHSLVEFNMHIPANAIMAALLAGVYLRPLDREERHEREDASDD